MSDVKDAGSSEKEKRINVQQNKENTLYVDICEIRGCLYSFELDLAQREIPPMGGADNFDVSSVKADVSLRMSPAHFKDIACMMMGLIVAYEQDFGKVESQYDIHNLSLSLKPRFGGKSVIFDSAKTPSVLN
jgi:hypothetical protein